MTTKKVPETKFQQAIASAMQSDPEWMWRGRLKAEELARQKVLSLTLSINAFLKEEGLI